MPPASRFPRWLEQLGHPGICPFPQPDLSRAWDISPQCTHSSRLAPHCQPRQLQGSGSVQCEIKVDGKVISQASANGGFNIASCEIDQNPLTNQWENKNG
jgi:hypothetical protein